MAENEEVIEVDMPQPVGATATVSDIDKVESEYDRLQKLIAQTQRAIKKRMDQLGVWAPDTPQYQKALRESNSYKKRLEELRTEAAPLKDQIDAYNAEQAQRKGAEAGKRSAAEAKAKRESDVNKAQTELENARANLERVRQKADERNWTKAATDRAVKAAQDRITAAENALKGVTSPAQPAGVSTPGEATPIVAPQGAVSPSGYDYTHGKRVGAGQVLWQEKGNWVVKNLSDFFGPSGQIKTEFIPQVRKALSDAGFSAPGNIVELSNGFRELVASTGGQYSPLEYGKWAGEFLGGGAGGAGGAGGGGPRTTTSVRVQDPRSLQQTINQVWNTYLKRDATWQEIKSITDLVNNEIKSNPITTTVDAAGNVKTSGFDESAIGAFIINQAKRRPEFKTQQGEDFEGWIDQNAGGIKFSVLVSDPGLDAVRRLYMAGNETDALRALKKLGTVAKAEASGIAGKMATAEQTLSAYARSMGVPFDVKSYAKSIADNMMSEEDVKAQIRELAKSYYPSWSKQLDAGQTMASIAYPYLNSMATVLELNPAEVSIDNPAIKRALASRDKDGNPTSQSLWDFEYSLRQDPRWAYTKNARSEIDSVARSVLRDFGLAY